MPSLSSIRETCFINDIEMSYEIRGQGEPVLLLHGFTGAGSDWEILGWEWLDGFHVIVPDLRGHLSSEK